MSIFWAQVWLIIRNDLRLLRRSTKASAFLNWVVVLCFSVLFHFLAIAIYASIKSPPSLAIAALIWWFLAFFMLGAAMNAAIGSLYERADFDLLLSSPVSTRAVLFARLGSTTAVGFLSVILFVPAMVDPAIFFFSPRYSGGFAVWILLAIGVAAAGTSFTLGLVQLLGVRRARTVSQVIAALLGAAVTMAGQLPNLLMNTAGGKRLEHFYAWITQFRAFLLPAQAARGELVPLAALAWLVVAAAGLTVWLLTRTFVSGLQDIASMPAKPARSGRRRWTEGLRTATFWKDFRLIARDPLLLAQILPQTVYALPMGFMAYRWIGLGAVAPAIFMMALVLSGALTAVSVAGEECWDLIRMSPSPELRLRTAKMAAGMMVPMIAVAVASIALAVMGKFWLGVVTLFVSFACSAGMARLAVASVIPVPRRDILRARRRASGGNTIVQIVATIFFMITGVGGLSCLAGGQFPIVTTILLALALLGAAACFAYVRFEAIVWSDDMRSA